MRFLLSKNFKLVTSPIISDQVCYTYIKYITVLSGFITLYNSLTDPWPQFFYCYFPNTIFFPTVQYGDPVTHTCIHSFFSHYHVPS